MTTTYTLRQLSRHTQRLGYMHSKALDQFFIFYLHPLIDTRCQSAGPNQTDCSSKGFDSPHARPSSMWFDVVCLFRL